MDLLTAAIKYLEAGLAPIPLWPDKRKNPKLTSYAEYYERQPTRDEWKRWAAAWPGANIGLITGYWRNMVALDFDDQPTYQLWLDGEGHQFDTWTVKTGRGYHVWFELDCDPGSSRMYKHLSGAEVLLRARGGYCIVPPSRHWSGCRYRTFIKSLPLVVPDLSFLIGFEEKKIAPPRKNFVSTPVNGSVRIENLIEPMGKPNGRGAQQAYCPFHDDKRPSAWVNVGQQRFGCNACFPGKWFDVINVYAMMNGISNRESFLALNGIGQ